VRVTGTIRSWLAGRWVIVAADVLVVVTVYTTALVIRLEGQVPSFYRSRFASALPWIAAAYVIVGFLAGMYTPTASRRRVGAVVLATGISIVVVVGIWPGALRPVPASVLALGALGSVVGFTGVRALAWNSRRGFA
jgi:hypothetical protein